MASNNGAFSFGQDINLLDNIAEVSAQSSNNSTPLANATIFQPNHQNEVHAVAIDTIEVSRDLSTEVNSFFMDYLAFAEASRDNREQLHNNIRESLATYDTEILSGIVSRAIETVSNIATPLFQATLAPENIVSHGTSEGGVPVSTFHRNLEHITSIRSEIVSYFANLDEGIEENTNNLRDLIANRTTDMIESLFTDYLRPHYSMLHRSPIENRFMINEINMIGLAIVNLFVLLESIRATVEEPTLLRTIATINLTTRELNVMLHDRESIIRLLTEPDPDDDTIVMPALHQMIGSPIMQSNNPTLIIRTIIEMTEAPMSSDNHGPTNYFYRMYADNEFGRAIDYDLDAPTSSSSGAQLIMGATARSEGDDSGAAS